ncbi:response regulator [Leucobacter sp. CSA1]|uniref:histidine kinase n=1 Tax=Leucobacter chromiisoli TaxID=2796471 RepID=A0A934Q8I5_9MICO|nr:PAS domain-containing sensor histidine kinase [Leucobacter chromiisoli]MBK0419801.1 response regulator [Leucobacter chromiisoli]
MYEVERVFNDDNLDLARSVLNQLATPVAVFAWAADEPEPLRFLAGNRGFSELFSRQEPEIDRAISRLSEGMARVIRGMGPDDDTVHTVVVPDETGTGHLRIMLQFAGCAPDHPARVIAEFQRLSDHENDTQNLRSRVRQLQDLADNSTALMYVKNPAGQYTIVNHYFARQFGRTPEEILGKTDHDLFDTTSADVYQENDRRVLESERAEEVEEPFSQIGGLTDPDEDRRWLSIKFPLLDDSGVPYALGAISTDITARKRAESAARQAMHEAERANQSKSLFLSRMSHELRTPLNAVLGFAELLRDPDADLEHQESVHHILEAGRHLLTLVNDVLDISWIESGAPGIEPELVPASVPIHQALEIVRPLAKQHGIEIASDLHGAVGVDIRVDPHRLRQVFFNVLGNAIKFNRPSGAIHVGTKIQGSALRYLVTDTGNGIGPEEIGRLFSPFERLSNADGIEGSGLGLALSRGLIDEMGGRLGVLHTAPGEGTTFYIDIPIAEAGGEAGLLSAVELPDPASAEVLVEATVVQIEDTVVNQLLLQRVLGRMGVGRLRSASSGAEGIALVRSLLPDVVLLDLNLKDISGVEVLAQLQRDEALSDIPVVILSADATPARISELQSRGAFAYLTKPFDPGTLQAILVSAVQVRS